ncbi:hypothetical protein Hypma_007473 [Hypsizygus marmoreus]|uniref:Uncharacterized protein n=1 Tax=Hypsizygus marmoreus TaxID=39966 RepID=A0A369K2T2_HYPMA|nr:hypothetical protein Hypma_007473 [Hypsizygus marmoreus]
MPARLLFLDLRLPRCKRLLRDRRLVPAIAFDSWIVCTLECVKPDFVSPRLWCRSLSHHFNVLSFWARL